MLSPAGVVLALLATAAVVLWPERRPGDVARVRPGTSPRVGPGTSPRVGPGTSPRVRLGTSPRVRPGLRRGPVGRGRRGRRQGPDPASAADALVLLALALRSGAGLPESLREVARGADGQVSRDLDAVVAALQWARLGPEAWEFASPLWRPVSQAWEVAVQTGTAPADLVEGVAHRLREAQERERERRAARAGVLLVLPLGLCFLPAFVCTAVVPVVLALAGGVIGW